ncbi:MULTISPECIES: SDR family oxidoreductase [unclassified Frondihabitans]|uniref:SDR family oxidoreductase n=1 Tax=unclassified Frondihabitans TaxID=2626248 RepID=UPI000F50D0E4|nr:MULTISPECIES: SDR family oxidoreductase [unclassified Frondihabitans]RPE77813.1 NAD(P)H dehydrogenase (quinone) [Frondihabitans sp. PhB153]RPF08092.1 NAD(P)H dehydrogenase (quinone) [Frondihabitans sp. PhB161]
MSIIVTGATGQLGRLAVLSLLDAGVPSADIVATGRDAAKLAALHAEVGVATRVADFADPESLTAAFAGGEKLLLVSTTDVGLRIGNHTRAIDAARAAGITLIAYTSELNADTARMRLAEEHRLTEQYLAQSGVPFVILRNGWYLERYTDQLSSVAETGTLVGGAGAGRVSAAIRQDYAEAAAAVLTSSGHEGRTYDLGGTSFTLAEMAAVMGDVMGQPVDYEDLSEDRYTDYLVGLGFPKGLARILADADTGISRDELITNSDDLARLLGRNPVGPAEALQKTLARDA